MHYIIVRLCSEISSERASRPKAQGIFQDRKFYFIETFFNILKVEKQRLQEESLHFPDQLFDRNNNTTIGSIGNKITLYLKFTEDHEL